MMFLAFIVGMIAWTFSEYNIHRFLGHEHKGKNFFKDEHTVHHSTANYFAPIYKKAMAAGFVSVLLVLILSCIINLQSAISFTAGYTGMYFLYELTHYRFHAKHPIRMFIKLRQRHFYHHFYNPKSNYGVTTNFWDRVFGTFMPVNDAVKIPARMAGSWLLQNHSYRKYFKIVGK